MFYRAILTALVTLLSAATISAETIPVPAGGNLQQAINAAKGGDVIVMAAGATFTGNFVLPNKFSLLPVTITSGGILLDQTISPAEAPLVATVRSGNSGAPFVLHNPQKYVLDGIRFENNVGGYGEIVWIEGGEGVVLRRLLIDVPEGQQQKRFILGNGRNITLTQSFCGGIWREGQDSQCFAAWNGAGPYKITQNYLEAASENVLFGGSDSTTADNVPADILIEGNIFAKRSIWRGTPRQVKNLLELKSAKRVIIRNNLFRNNWADAQSGTAILFTVRNQDCTAPWSVIEDVTFENNIVLDTLNHLSITGYDDYCPSLQTNKIYVRNNLFVGSGGGRFATLGAEIADLAIEHNTYMTPQMGAASAIALYDGDIATSGTTIKRKAAFAVGDFKLVNNMLQFNEWGIHSPTGMGSNALAAWTRTSTVLNNVFGGGPYGIPYPATTQFVSVTAYPAQFDSEYYLAATSQFKGKATDGKDIGRVAVVVEPPPVVEPVPQVPDLSKAVAELTAKLAATDAKVAELQAQLQAQNQRVNGLLNYLAATPSASKIQHLVNYLRNVPR